MMNGMKKINRADAREIGQPFYWSGSVCKNGKTFWRRTINTACQCKACKAEKVARDVAYFRANAEKINAYERARQAAKRAAAAKGGAV